MMNNVHAWNPMGGKSKEERQAIAAKGHATRQKRVAEERAAKRHAALLCDEIKALETKLTQLHAMETLTATSPRLTGKALLTEKQIVSAALPWSHCSGVYFLIKERKVIYVGQSVNIHARIASHPVKDFDHYAYVPCKKELLDKLESLYIYFLQPPRNGIRPDGTKLAPMELSKLLAK